MTPEEKAAKERAETEEKTRREAAEKEAREKEEAAKRAAAEEEDEEDDEGEAEETSPPKAKKNERRRSRPVLPDYDDEIEELRGEVKTLKERQAAKKEIAKGWGGLGAVVGAIAALALILVARTYFLARREDAYERSYAGPEPEPGFRS